MVENPNLSKDDAINEGRPSVIMNEGITQDGSLKQDIGGGMRTNAIPPNSNQRCTTGAHYVRRRKGKSSREYNAKNSSSSSAGRPTRGGAKYAVLALYYGRENKKQNVVEAKEEEDRLMTSLANAFGSCKSANSFYEILHPHRGCFTPLREAWLDIWDTPLIIRILL